MERHSRFAYSGALLLSLAVLIPDPTHSSNPERFFRLRWDPVGAATAYELQLTRKPKFDGQEIQLEARKPVTTLRLGPGNYLWRVRARDDEGRAGKWSPVRKLEVEAPPPSVTTEPEANAEPLAVEENTEPPEEGTTQTKPATVADKVAALVPDPPAPLPAPEQKPARIRQHIDEKTGWEYYALPKGKILKVIFETEDRGAGSDRVLIKVNNQDFQNYPGDRLHLEQDGRYHIASYAVDRVGNRGPLRRRKIMIDSTAPRVETSVLRGRLVIDAADPGIGVKLVQWRRESSETWQDYNGPIAPGPGDAVVFHIRATDRLDNATSTTFTFLKNQ